MLSDAVLVDSEVHDDVVVRRDLQLDLQRRRILFQVLAKDIRRHGHAEEGIGDGSLNMGMFGDRFIHAGNRGTHAYGQPFVLRG